MSFAPHATTITTYQTHSVAFLEAASRLDIRHIADLRITDETSPQCPALASSPPLLIPEIATALATTASPAKASSSQSHQQNAGPRPITPTPTPLSAITTRLLEEQSLMLFEVEAEQQRRPGLRVERKKRTPLVRRRRASRRERW